MQQQLLRKVYVVDTLKQHSSATTWAVQRWGCCQELDPRQRRFQAQSCAGVAMHVSDVHMLYPLVGFSTPLALLLA